MPVIEVIELLRQLKRVLGGERRLGRRDALFDHKRRLAGQQPQLPDFGAARLGEVVRVIDVGGQRLLRARRRPCERY